MASQKLYVPPSPGWVISNQICQLVHIYCASRGYSLIFNEQSISMPSPDIVAAFVLSGSFTTGIAFAKRVAISLKPIQIEEFDRI